MTDKEIIKALECCRDIDIKCETCQLWTVSECTKVLHQATLDLINRQQAEIEKWKDNCSKCGEKTTQTILYLQETLAEKNAEIERLQIRLRKVRNQFTDLSKMHSEIKAEAIKEFAERLIYEEGIGRGDDRTEIYICEDDVLEIVKEMVGEQG